MGHDDRLPPDGGPVLMVPVESQVTGRVNPDEADEVERLVRLYRDTYGVPSSGIGVVSPFRAQVVLLRKRLQDTGVAVDTIERFQYDASNSIATTVVIAVPIVFISIFIAALSSWD